MGEFLTEFAPDVSQNGGGLRNAEVAVLEYWELTKGHFFFQLGPLVHGYVFVLIVSTCVLKSEPDCLRSTTDRKIGEDKRRRHNNKFR